MEWDTGTHTCRLDRIAKFKGDGITDGSGLNGRFGVRGEEGGDEFIVFWHSFDDEPEMELATFSDLVEAKEFGWKCWNHPIEALAKAGHVTCRMYYLAVMGREVV
jgi:hypothetical protein